MASGCIRRATGVPRVPTWDHEARALWQALRRRCLTGRSTRTRCGKGPHGAVGNRAPCGPLPQRAGHLHVRPHKMSRSEFTKAERRELRELAGDVYEAEARQYLEELDEDFERWRKGEMLSSNLLTSIHQFHQHQNRELWN